MAALDPGWHACDQPSADWGRGGGGGRGGEGRGGGGEIM